MGIVMTRAKAILSCLFVFLGLTLQSVNSYSTEKLPGDYLREELADYFEKKFTGKDGKIDFYELLNTMGALSGFGCQISIRYGIEKYKTETFQQAFHAVKTKRGDIYYFGDSVNNFLLAAPADNPKLYSVYRIAASAAQELGATKFIDVPEMAKYYASTLGSAAYWRPRAPQGVSIQKLPLDVVKDEWPQIIKMMQSHNTEPTIYAFHIAGAAQVVMLRHKGEFDPEKGLVVFMEAAMPVSKLDPAKLNDYDENEP